MINIEGCICEHVDDEQPEMMWSGRPYSNSISRINEWFDQGHYTCFFNARIEEHREATVEWLQRHGMKSVWFAQGTGGLRENWNPN